MPTDGQPKSSTSPVAAALAAAVVGMVSCGRTFVWAVGRIPDKHGVPDGGMSQGMRVAMLLSPFVVGALLTGVAFTLLRHQWFKEVPDAATEEATPTSPMRGLKIASANKVHETSGALAVFLAIVGAGTAIGAFFGGLLGDLAGGAVIGAVLCLLLAVPAAVIVHLVGGNRK